MADSLAPHAGSARGSALRDALAIAWDIIRSNPTEDTCRHGDDADVCEGDGEIVDGLPEPCIDRSRRDRIREALSAQPSEPGETVSVERLHRAWNKVMTTPNGGGTFVRAADMAAVVAEYNHPSKEETVVEP